VCRSRLCVCEDEVVDSSMPVSEDRCVLCRRYDGKPTWRVEGLIGGAWSPGAIAAEEDADLWGPSSRKVGPIDLPACSASSMLTEICPSSIDAELDGRRVRRGRD